MLLAPAERADTIVDFSKYAGKTADPLQRCAGGVPGPSRLLRLLHRRSRPDAGVRAEHPAGYGPNTRTIMQVTARADRGHQPPAFDHEQVNAAFRHHADGSRRVRVEPAPDDRRPGLPTTRPTARASRTAETAPTRTRRPSATGSRGSTSRAGDLFTFDALKGNKLSIPLQPKAMHDEMNSASFDEFGRMTANLWVEAVPATPGRKRSRCIRM